ncbi:hypothetical protein ACFWXO_30930 [Kitasatospora sp. NPDC059088]|uniref:hypothetical protein n=1 Tax=Kitasatospora sp. NPDC059088 TaxID=3346722 RepID=UPI0036C038D1
MPTNDFFAAARSYALSGPTRSPEDVTVFQCEHVATPPKGQAPVAYGFISRPGSTDWPGAILTANDWAQGWEDVTPDSPTTPERPHFRPLGDEEDIAMAFADMLDAAELIWPQTLVMYHGNLPDYRALYFADVCLCPSCASENRQAYTLRSQDGIPVLDHVGRESITPARIL